MPEGVGMDVGKIMLSAEVAKPVCDTVRVHGRPVIPNKHIGGICPPVTVILFQLLMKKEKRRVAAELQLHSDQGFQYTSQAYFKLTQSYGITPSMSSKGNPYDNAMAENFFSILKTECIYRHKPKTFKEANDLIDRYIHFYNYERIQTKTGVAPLTQRHSA